MRFSIGALFVLTTAVALFTWLALHRLYVAIAIEVGYVALWGMDCAIAWRSRAIKAQRADQRKSP